MHAIERDDYRELPGELYNRSFIRQLSRAIGYDEDRALQLYERQSGSPRIPTDEEVSRTPEFLPPPKTGNALLLTLTLSVVVIVVAGTSYAFPGWWKFLSYPLLSSQKTSSPQTPPAPGAEPPPATATAPAPSPAPALPSPADELVLELRATGKCWTRIQVDSGKQEEFILLPDDVRLYRAKENRAFAWGAAGGIRDGQRSPPRTPFTGWHHGQARRHHAEYRRNRIDGAAPPRCQHAMIRSHAERNTLRKPLRWVIHLCWLGLLWGISDARVAAVATYAARQELGWLARYPVASEATTFPTRSGSVQARLYRPEGLSDVPALVLVHGIHKDGMDEARLKAFAQALAATGLLVLTPHVPSLADYRIEKSAVELIGWSAEALHRQTHRRVGVMGLSFAGGLCLVTAADRRFAPSIGYVLAVGAHDDLERVANFLLTNEIPTPGGETLRMPADPYGVLLFAYEYAAALFAPAEVEPGRAALRYWLWGDGQSP